MDFYKRTAFVCERIPRGKVSSYVQIAAICQKPKNARQAGYALGRRLSGRDIPAHRVVNSKGYLSGACSFDTPDRQKKLLEAEGVQVERTPEGFRVDLKVYGWECSFDDSLWFQAEFEKNGI